MRPLPKEVDKFEETNDGRSSIGFKCGISRRKPSRIDYTMQTALELRLLAFHHLRFSPHNRCGSLAGSSIRENDAERLVRDRQGEIRSKSGSSRVLSFLSLGYCDPGAV